MAQYTDAKPGDKAKIGLQREGKVVKVKSDGTRLVKDEFGSLKKEKSPEKPVDQLKQSK